MSAWTGIKEKDARRRAGKSMKFAAISGRNRLTTWFSGSLMDVVERVRLVARRSSAGYSLESTDRKFPFAAGRASSEVVSVIQELRKRLQNGFTPFAISLSNGHRYEVPHRDFIALSSKTVVVIDKDELPVSINPLHIVSILTCARTSNSAS
jgi:hypothetical protein